MSDIVITTLLSHLPKTQSELSLLGFANTQSHIYPFGSDSKIIGRLFEVISRQAVIKTADDLGYIWEESQSQTVYPDFKLKKPNGRYIAIDIKSTYRKYTKRGIVSPFGFTLGSFASFLRDNTKNISAPYDQFDAHYIIGFLYTREEDPSIEKSTFADINTIKPAYKDVEFFVQEKYKISGDKPGSGDTENIGTIKSRNIDDFINGNSPFSILGNAAFEDYWRHYPKYRSTTSNYRNLSEYFQWKNKETPHSADSLIEQYNTWQKK